MGGKSKAQNDGIGGDGGGTFLKKSNIFCLSSPMKKSVDRGSSLVNKDLIMLRIENKSDINFIKMIKKNNSLPCCSDHTAFKGYDH